MFQVRRQYFTSFVFICSINADTARQPTSKTSNFVKKYFCRQICEFFKRASTIRQQILFLRLQRVNSFKYNWIYKSDKASQPGVVCATLRLGLISLGRSGKSYLETFTALESSCLGQETVQCVRSYLQHFRWRHSVDTENIASQLREMWTITYNMNVRFIHKTRHVQKVSESFIFLRLLFNTQRPVIVSTILLMLFRLTSYLDHLPLGCGRKNLPSYYVHRSVSVHSSGASLSPNLSALLRIAVHWDLWIKTVRCAGIEEPILAISSAFSLPSTLDVHTSTIQFLWSISFR